MKMDSALKEMLESKMDQIFCVFFTLEALRNEAPEIKGKITEIFGESGFIVVDKVYRVNMDFIMCFWFESP